MSRENVIASQCAHWRGNPFSCNAQLCIGRRPITNSTLNYNLKRAHCLHGSAYVRAMPSTLRTTPVM